MDTHRCFTAAMVLAGCLHALPASAQSSVAVDYENGLAAYERCQWSEAVTLLERAAVAGDVRSQEIVGVMLVLGPALYGDEITQDTTAARRWFERASASGSALGTLMSKRLSATHRVNASVQP